MGTFMDGIGEVSLEQVLGLIPDSHYATIGKVAANWSVLEKLAESAIWRFARCDDEAGACITSQIYSLDGRLKALISLLKWRGLGDGLVAKLNKLAADSPGLGEQRNRIVHDPWNVSASGVPQRLQITAQKTLVMGFQPMPTDEVKKVADRIAIFIDRFETLILEVVAELERPPQAPAE